MSKKIKTIFVGTPDFGIPTLNALIESEDFDVISVISQPDKKIGRKQILTPPAIKAEALKNDIPVLQPERIKESIDEIKNLNPDLIVVVAYAQIIPQEILDLPKYGCINVHGSLLPKYRGAACIQAAILNGDDKTGITIMKMDAGLDTGDMLMKFETHIESNDTTASLFDKLSKLGGDAIVPTLNKYINGEIKGEKQNDDEASYVKMIRKEDGKIDWDGRATKVERLVRAMTTWPGAFSQLKIKNEKLETIKILEVKHNVISSSDKLPGEIFLSDNKLAVQCGQDALVIKQLQIAGKKPVSSEEFLRGYGDVVGKVFE